MTITVGEDGRDSEERKYGDTAQSAECVGASAGYALGGSQWHVYGGLLDTNPHPLCLFSPLTEHRLVAARLLIYVVQG